MTDELGVTTVRHALVAAVLLGVPGSGPAPPPQEPSPIRCGVEMRNVSLHVAEGVVLGVRALDGEFISETRGVPPVFDDPRHRHGRRRCRGRRPATTSTSSAAASASASSR